MSLLLTVSGVCGCATNLSCYRGDVLEVEQVTTGTSKLRGSRSEGVQGINILRKNWCLLSKNWVRGFPSRKLEERGGVSGKGRGEASLY